MIYGGSSSVGLFAIQLAKFAGYSVITACSPKNFELVKAHGADVVVDYHNTDAAVQKIREATSGTLTSALDCISEGDSAVICVKSLAQGGKGTVVQVGPPSDAAAQLASEKNVDMERVMAFTLFGRVSDMYHSPIATRLIYLYAMQPVPLGPNFTVPASPEDRAFYVKLNKDLPVFFEKFGLKPNPITDMPGGLEGIQAGFEVMKSGKVSASKLVYKVADV
jgi:threonine dehydrogenase-like Zn-dependent dehydrogenase